MAILEIAFKSFDKPIRLAEISKSQNISTSYLEQIFLKLKKAGIVRSVRGPGGGYVIGNLPSEIKIANIIDAVDENLIMTRCSIKEKVGCLPDKAVCNSHYFWEGLSHRIRDYFET
ncbi:MAG: Rrf2 family transcriptional regulator, partial [Janthinobacterium lividum]